MFDLIVFEAVNWNRNQHVFWDQQWKQIWFPEEIAVSKDIRQWQDFAHQDPCMKVLGGLTLLCIARKSTAFSK